MMRSLYSGVSGLRVHQTKMDVIGNNIANVNTAGFKASSVNFSDIYYQTLQGATGPNASTGAAGQNAMQVGLGSTLKSITANITKTGGSQRTDNPFDVAITGDSFFIVNKAGSNYFTKAGAFGVDADGTLCTASGAKVMGWQVDPKNPTKTVAATVSPLNVMAPENLYSPPEATTKAYMSGNIDSMDTQIAAGATGKIVNMEFYDNMGHKYIAVLKLNQKATPTNEYDVSITDILDENSKSALVKSNGATPPTYSKTAIDGFSFGGNAYTVAVDSTTGKVTLTGTASTLTFDGIDGTFKSVGTATGKSLNFAITTTGPNPFKSIEVDFSKLTQFAKSGKTTVEANKGSVDGLGKGKKAGNMTGLSVDTSGLIYGSYDNGDKKLLGQIAVASFANPSGLEAVGDSLFAATQNSGDFDGIGHDVKSDGGSFTTGVLEMSNVDLSQEFTEMITTQRGFQANSRIITTSDTMLEELINLKR